MAASMLRICCRLSKALVRRKRVHQYMAPEQLEGKDADAIDIFALGEDSDFKVCYLSLRSSGNYLHFPVFPAKIPKSSDIDANKPNFQGRTLGPHPGDHSDPAR
jgi:serine/threonine protein kinase